MHMNDKVAKEQTLLNIQEILTSGFENTNQKIDRLQDQVVNLQNLFSDSTITLEKILNKLDTNYPELVATIENKPPQRGNPRVIAQIEEGQVVFRSSDSNDMELHRITMGDLKNIMDSKQLLVFRGYESSLDKNLEEWSAAKKEGKLDNDPKAFKIGNFSPYVIYLSSL
jgi:hypothetical protein